MKQFHPLLLITFIFSILVFVISLKYHQELQNYRLTQENQKFQIMAQKIVAFKKAWQNITFQEKKLKRFIKNLSKKHIKYTKHSTFDNTEFTFNKLTPVSSKYILDALINQNTKINSIDIKHIDNSSISIKIRIAK